MTQFTVEEMNLLSIYHEGSREQLRENMNAALPYMDADRLPCSGWGRASFSVQSTPVLPLLL